MEQNIGRYRWTICSLVFFATTINYLDRAVISLLKSTLTTELKWDDGDYTNVEIAFKVSYAIGLLLAGRFIDTVGTKKGYAWATGLWSVAAVLHAAAKSVFGFSVARAALGVTEAGNFPAAIKTVAEWFPRKERALATGLFNSGANIGAIVAPLTVPFIAAAYGWQWAFIATGLLGFIWLIFWNKHYYKPSEHPKLSKAELAYINIESQYHIKGTAIALPVAAVYTMSAVGSIFGGWLPMYFIKKNWPVFKARKSSMLLYAFLVLPILFAQVLGGINMWLAVFVIGIAASAHQAWSANIFTTVSDMFPKRAVGSVTGIGGMFGAIGGILLSMAVQKNLFVHYRAINQIETAYYIMFIVCGSAYLLAWLIMHLLVPKVSVIAAEDLE